MSKSKTLIYGVTGYTGELIAKKAKEIGLSIVVAGRNTEKTNDVAQRLGVEGRSFGLKNDLDASKALEDVRILINAAGPFEATAEPLAEIAIANGCHYLDIAGEVLDYQRIAELDGQAKAQGVLLMPGVGFGIVPTDCAAALVKSRMPNAVKLVLAFQTHGGVSQGTLRTLFKDIHKDGVVRQNGQLVRARPAMSIEKFDFGQGLKNAAFNPWRGDLFTAYITTGIPNIETYSAFPPPIIAIMKGGLPSWLIRQKLSQKMLNRLFDLVPAGPSEKQLSQGSTAIVAEAYSEDGAAAKLLLKGPEAYVFTAATAAHIAQKLSTGAVPAGFHTPAQLLGGDFILLIPGVTVEWR